MISSDRRPRVRAAVFVALAGLLASCGSSSTSSPATTAAAQTAAATPATSAPAATEAAAPTVADTTAATETVATEAAATTAAKVECTGDPIKLTMTATLTGPLAFASFQQGAEDALKASLTAINDACKIGRPLAVTICDDKSDPNESTTCGRTAKSDGSLALFGSIGTQPGAAEASGLPMLLTEGVSLSDLTSPIAFSGTNAITLVLGSLSAAAASGVKDYLFVAADGPATQLLVGQLAQLATQLGIKMEPLLYPADTTDFAPIAAQISGKNPSAIGFAVPAVVPFFNALSSEGITPKDKLMFTSVALIPPEVIKELGDKIEGIYLISQSVPAQDSTNAGIKQMLAEYESAGVKTAVGDIGNFSVAIWSKAHVIDDAIAKLSPDKIKTLDTAGLQQALLDYGAIDRPELAKIDFSANAFPENPVLSTLRVFSRYAMAVQVTGGTYKTVSPFGDVTKPFTLS